MSYYIIEFFKYEIAQGLYIVRDGPDKQVKEEEKNKFTNNTITFSVL